MNILSVLAIILAVAGLILAFRYPIASAVAGYAAVVCACVGDAGGEFAVSANVLLFWGVAAVIVLGLSMLNSGNPMLTRLPLAYATAGTAVGAVLGLCFSHTAAAVTAGSALGAFLGSLAFTRTPSGAVLRKARHAYIDYLCGAGLPAVVCCSMAAVAVAAVVF